MASPMNAVLQDSAKACSRSLIGAVPSALWNTSPSTVIVGGQLAGDAGVSPCSISAVDVITLNDEPGGKAPPSAWSNSLESGTLTAARIAPVEALTATRAAFLRTPDSAASAACCTAGADGRLHRRAGPRAEPREGGHGQAFSALSTVIVAPGRPASCRSYACSSPVWPTTLLAL